MDIDLLADRYRQRFPFAADGDTGKDGGDGDTGKDASYVALGNVFKDLDKLSVLYRNRFDKLDASDGDTGKDVAFEAASLSVGNLINDLDTLADKYKTRLAVFSDGDTKDGDTGKDGAPDVFKPGEAVINWPYTIIIAVVTLVAGIFIGKSLI
jgi:hypothetical protein